MPLPAANDARIARRDARDLVKDLPPPPRRPRRKNPTSVDEGAPSLPYFIVALLPQLISLPPYIFIASFVSSRGHELKYMSSYVRVHSFELTRLSS